MKDNVLKYRKVLNTQKNEIIIKKTDNESTVVIMSREYCLVVRMTPPKNKRMLYVLQKSNPSNKKETCIKIFADIHKEKTNIG